MNAISRRNFLRYTGVALGAVSLTGIVSACGGDEEPTAEPKAGSGGSKAAAEFGLIKTMKDRGHAIIGMVDSPPSGMIRNGEMVGWNIDIIRMILEGFGVTELKPLQADFTGMVPGLQAKRMDICGAGLLITDERCEIIALTDPVDVLLYSMAVKKGNPKNLMSIASIKETGSKLAIESATTQERIAKEILTADMIQNVSGRPDGVDAVRVGRADAYIAPVEALKSVVTPETGLEITETVPDMPKIGSSIAMRKEDADFVKAFNEAFAKMVESGEYAEIMKKYDGDPELINMEGIRDGC